MDANATEDKIWYYEQNGQRLGPVTMANIVGLIQSGILARGSAVWKSGLADWQRIEDTELGAHLDNSAPPPLPARHVSNTVVWVLAFAPIIGLILEYIFAVVVYGDGPVAEAAVSDSKFWYITLGLNIGLSFRDARQLRKAGHDTSKFSRWTWLVPVYLFQRAKSLKHNLAYFIVWIVCFGLTFLV